MPDPTPTFDPDGTALAPAVGPDELGRLGGYVVRRLLGEGGMGRVYAADDPALGRQVALKVMRPEAAKRPEAKERFIREARAAAAVTHDHIVRIYQVGEDGGVPFIAMEMLSGHPLDTLVARPVPMTEVIRIGTEVSSALAAAHALGLIHRDIKPANLWLEEPSGRVKVLDFGLARLTRELTLTNTGQIFGTPAYMAPEQAAAATLDGRADVFSLGCVLYHLATGRRPFDGSDVFAVLHQIANLTPPPPHNLNPQVPPGLSALISRMMSKTADDRPTSAEVADELRGGGTPSGGGRVVAGVGPRTGHDAGARKQALLAILHEAKLAHAHTSASAWGLLELPIGLGLGAGGIAGGTLATYVILQLVSLIPGVSNEWVAKMSYLVGAVCVALGGLAGIVAYLWWRVRRWRRRIAAATQRLRTEFPHEAAVWGGEMALRNAKAVEALVVQVVADNFNVSPAPVDGTVELRSGTSGRSDPSGVVPRTDPAARKQALIELLLVTKKAQARLSVTPVALLYWLIAVGIGIGCLVFGVGLMALDHLLFVNERYGTPLTGLGLLVNSFGSWLLPIGYLVWHYWRWRQRRARAIDRLLREYPVEASQWVGSVSFRDREVVEELFAAVQADDFAVSPAAVRPASLSTAGRRLRLVSILLDAKAAHKRLSLFYIPPFWEIVLGLFVALLGIPIGVLAFLIWHAVGSDKRGIDLTIPLTGLFWAVGSLLMMFLLSHRKARRQLLVATDRLLNDFRTEATEWGGELALQDRTVVTSLLNRLIVSGY